jgi:flagellar biogenesis protein FliO
MMIWMSLGTLFFAVIVLIWKMNKLIDHHNALARRVQELEIHSTIIGE